VQADLTLTFHKSRGKGAKKPLHDDIDFDLYSPDGNLIISEVLFCAGGVAE
jgi:hypothetical protein